MTTARRARRPAHPGPAALIDARHTEGVVIDTDAVLTDALPLRSAAWAETMQAFAVQYAHVTGDRRALRRPAQLPADRMGQLDRDIAASLLRLQGGRIDLAAQHLGPSEEDLISLLAAESDRRLLDLATSRPVRCRPGARRLLRALRAEAVAVAAVSTTRQGAALLRRSGLAELVTVCVDARDAEHYGLAGPPGPAMLRFALTLLHARAVHAVSLAGTSLHQAAAQEASFRLGILVQPGDRSPCPGPDPAGRAWVERLDEVVVGTLR
ncbi:HAD family hydrolase [Kitasatospora sp. NPDC050543]|uniref:HAD family hydrolase n=1 Tax=Kitasatospora sp. NPDC050543 TaxID=3364054 RepID=UPI0037B24053